jgi:hypothetical protein
MVSLSAVMLSGMALTKQGNHHSKDFCQLGTAKSVALLPIETRLRSSTPR